MMKKLIAILFLFISVVALSQPTSGGGSLWNLRIGNYLYDYTGDRAMYPLNRRLYDTSNTEIINFQTRTLGLGINTATYYGYLKSDSLTSNRTYQFPDSSGMLAIGVTGGYVQKITDAVQFDFFGADDMEITNDNGGFTKAHIGLTGTSSFLGFNGSILNVRNDSMTYDKPNIYFGVSSSGISFASNTILKAFIRTNLLTANRFYEMPDASGTLALSSSLGDYLKRDGTTALTGNWTAGNFSQTLNTLILGSSTSTISGGSAAGDQLKLQSTTGNGTSTVAGVQINVGNNGATNAMNFYNDGQVLINSTTRNPGALGILRIGQGTSTIDIGQHSSGVGSSWFGKATPSTTNYSLAGDANNTYLNAVTGGTVFFMHNNAIRGSYNSTAYSFTPGASGVTNTYFTFTQPANTGGVPTGILFTGGAHTGVTSGTEFQDVYFNIGRTVTWLTTVPTTQRWVRIPAPTMSCASSSTSTTSATLSIAGPPAAAGSAAITNPLTFWVESGASAMNGSLAVNKSTLATSTLQVAGSLGLPYTAQTTTYPITATDYTIDCTSGTFTVTLPTAVGITGRIYVIKNTGAGTITIATTSSQTIDGSTTATIAVQYGSLTVQSNGANWIVL